jgi:glucan biosynthesis protein C
MSGQQPGRRRLFFVDNLRIYLTVLVVLHHLAIIYGASGAFPYKEAQPDDLAAVLLTLVTAIDAPYFMGFWFLIAGYFTPGSYDRKGGGAYLRDRLLRLGIPLLFYILLMDPLIGYALSVNVHGSAMPLLRFYTAHISSYGQRGLGVGPLWFVALLLVFAFVYVLWRRLVNRGFTDWRSGDRGPGDRGPGFTPAPQDQGAAPGNLSLVLFALALALATWIVRLWYPIDRWVKILLLRVEIAHLPQYLGLFVAGLVAYRRNWFLRISDAAGRLWLWIAVACIVLLPIIFVAGGAMEGKVDEFKGGTGWRAVAVALWEAFLCVGMVVGLLVLFRKRLDRQGALAKAMSAACFAVYIIHQPVLIALGLALSGVRLPHLLKFVLVAPLAVALCFALAHYIRKAPLVRRIL